jgi:hypothetical protein
VGTGREADWLVDCEAGIVTPAEGVEEVTGTGTDVCEVEVTTGVELVVVLMGASVLVYTWNLYEPPQVWVSSPEQGISHSLCGATAGGTSSTKPFAQKHSYEYSTAAME